MTAPGMVPGAGVLAAAGPGGAAAAVAGAGVLALALALARWLRVSQREHYLAGSCLATARRWVGRRPPNGALAAVALAGAGLAVAVALLDAGGLSLAGAAAAVVAVAVLPWGMPVRGRPPLRLTRRARTLTAVAVLFSGVVVAAVGLVLGWVPAVALAAVAAPALVDAAAAATAPVERRALERHRRAAEARLHEVAPFVVAVTGSWGKTSTKNHIRDLLGAAGEVVASPASWNNTAGLSRTMNEHLTSTTDVLVVEMGMYGPGEIRQLCAWVPPDVAVICAVGPMHLERVGSMEGIVAAKAEILERAPTAVLWVDDPRLAALAETCPAAKLWRVGTRGRAGLDVEVEPGDDGIAVWAHGELIGRVPTDGGVHAGNAGCAVAAALAYGAPPAEVGGRLAHLANPAHRATVATSDAGVVVVDDTFNSNPEGARAALGALTRRVGGGRRAVVTPGMVELGGEQDARNRDLARDVVGSGATLVVVGWTNRRALLEGAGGDAVVVADRAAARAWVRDHLAAGDGVLWENDLPDHYP